MEGLRLSALVALLALPLGGCGQKRASGVPGTPSADDLVTAWKKVGLSPDAFASTDAAAFSAGHCARGRVAGVDALVCAYADEASLVRGKATIERTWEKENVRTAVITRTERTLLAVADDRGVDPAGKTINRLVSAARQLRAE